MIFTETVLKDVFLIDLELTKDERGMFMRIWCEREFEFMDFRRMG
jgi:dTDP-4-dehydrorhamnose 3,5-epimerase